MADSPSDSGPLEDFPLHGEALPGGMGFTAGPRETARGASRPAVARLGARWSAAAADAATVLLLAALAILAARVTTGAIPRLAGVGWALGFAAYLSFFSTVLPLILFGKTVGMALADLSARSDAGGRLSAAAALRRWLATAATVSTAGLLLLWTASHPEAPTPADRFSGHALTVD